MIEIERIGILDMDKMKNDINRLYISERGYLYLHICYSNFYECDIFLPVSHNLTIIADDYEYDYDKMVYTPVYTRIYDCTLAKHYIDRSMSDLKKVEVYEQDGKVKNDFIMR